MIDAMSQPLAERLVAAIAAQDQAQIAGCFAEAVEFRAMVPPGVRERSGASEVGALVAGWFSDSTVLELADVSSTEVGDRLHIRYRFTGVEDGQPYVVEQQLYCTVVDDKIERADLLCSGFRPPPSA
jgi:hypothetical protein